MPGTFSALGQVSRSTRAARNKVTNISGCHAKARPLRGHECLTLLRYTLPIQYDIAYLSSATTKRCATQSLPRSP